MAMLPSLLRMEGPGFVINEDMMVPHELGLGNAR